ncbi:uncharacterized protein LY89DRAFT_416699 [Mollisia scopiformis]|uniref:Uncharacterized protein n=1 Tax=Mollisia scopiformis TaxID=149040 RepID=A0A194XL57_MOLSC|nr:uncharacterized protein LY89DRAFT_416699 [Mollisia scopiformis]KUJ20866.1 hypothetical protein LY89DRAFT_416699 [Mollisia scopiformis]
MDDPMKLDADTKAKIRKVNASNAHRDSTPAQSCMSKQGNRSCDDVGHSVESLAMQKNSRRMPLSAMFQHSETVFENKFIETLRSEPVQRHVSMVKLQCTTLILACQKYGGMLLQLEENAQECFVSRFEGYTVLERVSCDHKEAGITSLWQFFHHYNDMDCFQFSYHRHIGPG